MLELSCSTIALCRRLLARGCGRLSRGRCCSGDEGSGSQGSRQGAAACSRGGRRRQRRCAGLAQRQRRRAPPEAVRRLRWWLLAKTEVEACTAWLMEMGCFYVCWPGTPQQMSCRPASTVSSVACVRCCAAHMQYRSDAWSSY
jgi:hypothetical protein